MADQVSDKVQPPTPSAGKKPYTAPVLQKWGTMRQITMAVGQSGSHDGASNKRNVRTAA